MLALSYGFARSIHGHQRILKRNADFENLFVPIRDSSRAEFLDLQNLVLGDLLGFAQGQVSLTQLNLGGLLVTEDGHDR